MDFLSRLRYGHAYRLGVPPTIFRRVAERVPWNLIRLAPAEGSRAASILHDPPVSKPLTLIEWGLP